MASLESSSRSLRKAGLPGLRLAADDGVIAIRPLAVARPAAPSRMQTCSIAASSQPRQRASSHVRGSARIQETFLEPSRAVASYRGIFCRRSSASNLAACAYVMSRTATNLAVQPHVPVVAGLDQLLVLLAALVTLGLGCAGLPPSQVAESNPPDGPCALISSARLSAVLVCWGWQVADGEVTNRPRSKSGLPSVICGLLRKLATFPAQWADPGFAKPVGSKAGRCRSILPSGILIYP